MCSTEDHWLFKRYNADSLHVVFPKSNAQRSGIALSRGTSVSVNILFVQWTYRPPHYRHAASS